VDMNRLSSFSYKAIAVIVAWFAWLIPLGLHRVMMRRCYAWLHPLAFLCATLASNEFFQELGGIVAAQDAVPRIDFSHAWLLSFSVAWFLLVVYDAIAVFSWSVKPEEVVAHCAVSDHGQVNQ